MAGNILELGPDTFDKTIADTKGALVVYFYGPYCGQCMAFTPIFEEVAAEMGDKALFAKVNSFEHIDLGLRCGIRGTPTIVFYKNGQQCDKQLGGEPKEAFKSRVGACIPR
jgi:thioredoxin-like negative regulator of GroEL